ncbi:MAG: transporter substrate-binding domain-containing protein [Clostridiales bacterium]|nr:transporter substrate-binding domain-containing protein [Clostridiales bacterium]
MKKLLSILLVLALVFSLAACGGGQEADPTNNNEAQDESDLGYVKENGKLVIVYTDYAPMNYTDENGEFTGFDTELATLVCEKLGLEPVFVEINWDTKEVELNAKSIDCIWNGLTIDDERKATMEITVPYVKNAQVVLVKEGTAYEGTESLIGKAVAAEQGSAGEKIIETDENLQQANYVPKTLQTECLMEVKAGTADAAVLDLTLAKTMTGEGTSYEDLEIVDHLAEENYGVAFRKGSDICAEVNKIFTELVEDGSMGALADKYGLELAE